MQRPSASTTIAPDPTEVPAAATGLRWPSFVSPGKSIGRLRNASVAGRKPNVGPEGANALRFRPPAAPPAFSIISANVVPIEISNTPGLATSPQTLAHFKPSQSRMPWSLNH